MPRWPFLQVNEQMLEQLDIISPAHKNRLAVDESNRMAALSEKQQKIAKQIGFSVAIDGDDDQDQHTGAASYQQTGFHLRRRFSLSRECKL